VKKILRSLFCSSLAILLISCGGGDTSITSPGELGQVSAPSSGTGTIGGGTSTVVKNGTCPDGTETTEAIVAGNTFCAISGTIESDLTLTDDVYYTLVGRVDVGIDIGGDGNKAGGKSATLTIPAGVTIASKTASDFLQINRGSKIMAEGTVSNPIIFTSSQKLDGSLTNEESARGLWGGIVILGRAPINKCSNDVRGTAACEKVVEGSTDSLMGGNISDDNSGSLKFVRVEYAGYEIFPGNELNGITFGGVGNGTTVDYIQVHNNLDDCVEFFGGTVDVKHLVCTGAGDDNLDIDWGYTGRLQFVLVKQTNAGDHIVESDNTNADATVGYLTTPRSTPKVANFTFLSNGSDEAMKYKEGVSGIYMNGIVKSTGAKGCIEHTKLETLQDAPGYDKIAHHSVFMDCGTGKTYAAGDDSATDAELKASIEERVTNTTVGGTSTLVGTYFLGENESNITSAFNNVQAVCAVGTHADGSTTTLCPTYSTKESAYTMDPWFRATNYIGAFSPGSDEDNNWAAGWTTGLFTAANCPEGTTETEVLRGQKVCSMSGTLTTDLTLTRGNYYRLDGKVQVGEDMGSDGTKAGGASATLTIEPGVTVFGESGNDYLVIMRGSKIMANGTSSAPIIMTGRDDILGEVDQYTRGLWGGLVILGKAQINKCTYTNSVRANPCEKEVEGSVGDLMGGETNDDSSGSLKYLRVQYAGYEVFPGNELNGITFGGVGSGTTVDYVQVHNNQDDCVEFFGGTVDVKHLICTGAGDDNLDIDWGYTGRMQYVIVQQADDTGDHIVESDNTNSDASVGYLTEPRSNPIISNFTFISKGHDDAVKLKEGVSGQYKNGIVRMTTGSKACVEHTKAETIQDAATTKKFSFNSVLFSCAGGLAVAGDDSATAAQLETIIKAGSNNLYATASGGGSYVSSLSGVINGTAETAATVTAIPAADNTDSFFDAPTYVGAVSGSTDTWYKGWTVAGSIEID